MVIRVSDLDGAPVRTLPPRFQAAARKNLALGCGLSIMDRCFSQGKAPIIQGVALPGLACPAAAPGAPSAIIFFSQLIFQNLFAICSNFQ
jgi:hypothetical protein